MIAYNTITNGKRSKIARCGDYTAALAGPAWLRAPLEEWCKGGCDEKRVPSVLMEHANAFVALIIDNATGKPYEFDNGYLVPVSADYTAIGSGALLALGAMAHGASAEEAVIAASQHDKNTGGPVTCLSFRIPELTEQ